MSPPPDTSPSEPVISKQAWTFIIVGVVLVTAFFSVALLAPKPSPPPSPVLLKKRVSRDQVPMVTGEEPLPQMFTRAGCPVCHVIPGISGADGRVGPPLTLGSTGVERLADPAYTGGAETVKEYIVESILNPRIYVVRGYPDRTMPTWYGSKLTAQALDRIARYLETLSEG